MSSWYDAWADRYGDFYSGIGDIPFYAGLAREADGPLVELAVGTGRVAIAVAQATGRSVIGIDSSAGMLAQARLRAAAEGVRALRHRSGPADASPGSAFAFDHRIADNRADIALDEGGTGSLWWATKNEWLGLIDVSGLQLEALYGGFDGEPLTGDSREYVFVARR